MPSLISGDYANARKLLDDAKKLKAINSAAGSVGHEQLTTLHQYQRV